jgi:uncharacterized membrane protein SpoIIM required for sporulation
MAFLAAGFARQVRAQWPLVLAASLLLFMPLLLTALWVYLYPEQVYSILDPAQVAAMQSMYDPQGNRLGRSVERLASEDWRMFGYYVMNNIGIAFQTFASGLL